MGSATTALCAGVEYRTEPLSKFCGIAINGIRIEPQLPDEFVDNIAGLLYQHAVVCIRDQELDPEALAEFGARFGKPVHHNEVNLRLDGLPGVMSLSNADDRDDRQLNGGAHWHTDLIHTEEPASFTMLNAIAVPAQGGGTLFADQIAAYQAYPVAMRRRLDDLTVVHCYEARTDGSMPNVRQPLVREHPVTGLRALYGAADTGVGIDGMHDEEARALLQQLAAHATDERFVYRHQYQLHDLVMWDNAQLLHSAEPLKRARSSAENRIMHRVSVRGWPRASNQPTV